MKKLKPPPPSPTILQNLFQNGISIHTLFDSRGLTLHISNFKIIISDRRHAYTILFCKRICKRPKKQVFYFLGKGHMAYSHSLDTKGSDTDIYLQMSFLIPDTFWHSLFSPKYPRLKKLEIRFFFDRKVFEIFCRNTMTSLFIN